ncbi:MAG: UDP-2,3-diacylglucosamine diphosphatase [Isosphaeraceae bacterium]
MPTYFVSDIHLRLDHPERSQRFARWVAARAPADALYIVGDLCDFWFSARQSRRDPMACEGLRSLADFASRGGSLTILLGNHDNWLGPLYREKLGARLMPEPLDVEVGDRRYHLVHGHLLGGRSRWKGWMEGEGFFHAFGALPHPAAWVLANGLEHVNEARLEASHRRHLAVYRDYVDALPGLPHAAVMGHVHLTLDEPRPNGARMIVLGSWHGQSSYLFADDEGDRQVVEPR